MAIKAQTMWAKTLPRNTHGQQSWGDEGTSPSHDDYFLGGGSFVKGGAQGHALLFIFCGVVKLFV